MLISKKILEIDKTGLIKEKSGSPLGSAHELLVRSIMMRLGIEVGSVDLASGPYDLIIKGYKKFDKKKLHKNKHIFLRAQIKTLSNNTIRLGGGVRAGIDRKYKSGVKGYKYSEEQNDIIIGVDKNNLDLYLLPTIFAKKYGKSVSVTKVEICKNNWELLLNWNSEFLKKIEGHLKK